MLSFFVEEKTKTFFYLYRFVIASSIHFISFVTLFLLSALNLRFHLLCLVSHEINENKFFFSSEKCSLEIKMASIPYLLNVYVNEIFEKMFFNTNV